jgi:hypothetical protein
MALTDFFGPRIKVGRVKGKEALPYTLILAIIAIVSLAIYPTLSNTFSIIASNGASYEQTREFNLSNVSSHKKMLYLQEQFKSKPVDSSILTLSINLNLEQIGMSCN